MTDHFRTKIYQDNFNACAEIAKKASGDELIQLIHKFKEEVIANKARLYVCERELESRLEIKD